MTRSWSAGRRSEWSSIEKTAWSRYVSTSSPNSCSVVCAHLRLYGDVQRGSRGLSANGGGAKRARQVQEGVSLRHGGQCGRREMAGVVRRRGLSQS